MLLRTFFVPDAPAKEFRMQDEDFKVARFVEVERTVDGVKQTVRVPKVETQSLRKKAHIGESCDMYRIENLQRAGVTLSTVDVSNFLQPNLERQSALIELANDESFVRQAVDALSDKKPLNNDVESIKFD